jgi:predicted amidohydrolase
MASRGVVIFHNAVVVTDDGRILKTYNDLHGFFFQRTPMKEWLFGADGSRFYSMRHLRREEGVCAVFEPAARGVRVSRADLTFSGPFGFGK